MVFMVSTLKQNTKDLSSPVEVDSDSRRIQEQRQGIGQGSKGGISLSLLPFQGSAGRKAAIEW